MSSLPALQALIRDKFGLDPSTLDPHAALSEQGIDSLAMVEVLFDIERQFGISVPDQASNIGTLADLAAVIDRLRTKQAA